MASGKVVEYPTTHLEGAQIPWILEEEVGGIQMATGFDKDAGDESLLLDNRLRTRK